MTNSQLAPVLTEGYEVFIDNDEGVAHIVFGGVIRLKELVDSFSELIRHPDFIKDIACCYDCTNALVEVNLTETEIFYHFAAGLRQKRGDKYSLAFVYSDEMTKVLVQFYRLFLARTEIDVELFEHKSNAISWLKEEH